VKDRSTIDFMIVCLNERTVAGLILFIHADANVAANVSFRWCTPGDRLPWVATVRYPT
jgi:hypothetical protein